MVTRKVAPALAAGCTVVLKPAEQSPLTAIRLEELWVKAGGPPDVFQVVTTSDPAAFSDVFFDDARVRKLTFTGSTEVGIKLYAKAAQTVKRVSLELGGHAPFIICDDADIPAAVRRRWRRSSATPARRASAPTASTCTTRSIRRSPSSWRMR